MSVTSMNWLAVTAAGGGIQDVDGELPIYVETTNSGRDVTVKIKDATTSEKGSVQLTSGPYNLKTDETLAVTPKGVRRLCAP